MATEDGTEIATLALKHALFFHSSNQLVITPPWRSAQSLGLACLDKKSGHGVSVAMFASTHSYLPTAYTGRQEGKGATPFLFGSISGRDPA